MQKVERQLFYEQIKGRLPALLWKLPHWPKGYLNHIPAHLFVHHSDFTPQDAVQEISRNLERLLDLAEDGHQAHYLSEKIACQINVLVQVGQLQPLNKHVVLRPKSLTRQNYIQDLKKQESQFLAQKEALRQAMEGITACDEMIQALVDIDIQLNKLQDLLHNA